MRNHEIYHETKSVLQSCSALMIITNMPITQDLSLIPKLGSLRSSLNSDSRILSTWQKKAPLATHNLALRGQQSSRPPLLLSELSFFKEAREALWIMYEHSLCANTAKLLLKSPFGASKRFLNLKNHEIYLGLSLLEREGGAKHSPPGHLSSRSSSEISSFSWFLYIFLKFISDHPELFKI